MLLLTLCFFFWSLYSNAVLSVFYSFAIISLRKRGLVVLLQLYSLPRCTVGWSVIVAFPGLEVIKLEFILRVSKGAKSRNQYNQVPRLTQDTNGKVTNSQLDTTNETQNIAQ